MEVSVRVSSELARAIGITRLRMELPEGAAISDLVEALRAEYPAAAEQISATVAVVGGQHAGASQPLSEGQEVSLLIPIAGGCC